MKSNVSLKYLALGLTTGLLGFSGSVYAQAANQNYQLVGVNARLVQTINTDTVKQGQQVEAKLDGTVTTSDGVKLERGTELVGTVAEAAPSANRGPASVTLVFTKAQLKDGKEIPVKVTLLAAYPASEADDATYGDSIVGPAPQHIDPKQTVLQEPGLLSHVEMKSAVQGDDSGTFSKVKGNFRLSAGTYLQLGIAAQNGAGATTGE
jgi:hypothetical protein